jgi:hypothetical protein
VYQSLAPEINTTRRSDHATRFKTTWNSLFVSLKSTSDRAAVTLTGPDFFSRNATQSLLANKTYMQNDAVQLQQTNLENLGAVQTTLSSTLQAGCAVYGIDELNTVQQRELTQIFNDLANYTAGKSPFSRPSLRELSLGADFSI